MPTNSPEIKADIFDGGTPDSNYLERLIEVSEALMERFSTLYTEMETGNKLKKYPDWLP